MAGLSNACRCSHFQSVCKELEGRWVVPTFAFDHVIGNLYGPEGF